MPTDWIFKRNSVRSQYTSRFPGCLQRLSHVVSLGYRDLHWMQQSFILQTPKMKRQQLPLHQFGRHDRQFTLHQLEACTIGRLNCSLTLAYSNATSKQALAAPVAPHAIPYLASSRHDNGPLIPRTFGGAYSILTPYNQQSAILRSPRLATIVSA